jgi:exodeoxyribonuclease VII small subunit
MSPEPTEPLTFEQALSELERILRKLEDGSTTLEQSLAQYERGVGLLKSCFQQLRSAEQRIVKIAGVDGDGKPVLQTFEHSATLDAIRTGEPRGDGPANKPKRGDSSY